MTYNKLPMIAIAIALASCSLVPEVEESPVDPDKTGKEEITLTAYCGEPETRTVRESDGSVLWSPGDEISLFYGSGSEGGSKFTAQNTEKAKVVNFRGEIGVITGGNDVSVEDTYFWATYPYCAEASCDGNSITTVLPSAQLATADTFADDLFPSIGRSRGLDMAFYNICGGIKFTVSEAGIKTVTLKGNSGEQIAGKITVGFDDNGIPIVLSIADGSDTITLSAPDDECLEVGKAYYIVLAPTVFETGFTMTFSKELMQAVKNRTSKTTIRRSVFGTMTTPDQGLDWEFLSTVVPPDNEIWYKTVSGEAQIYDQSKPFNVNIVSQEYENGWWKIKCDGEIKTVNDNAFPGGSDITELLMPDSIEELKPWALSVLGVTRLYIPKNLKTVGYGALRITNNLLNTFFDDSGNDIYSGISEFYGHHVSTDGKCVIIDNTLYGFAYYGCSSYSIPEGVEIIAPSVFAQCEELETINFPSTLLRIEMAAFQNCTKLSGDIFFPESLESVDYSAFQGCDRITAFYGNNKVVSADHHCLLLDYNLRGIWLGKYAGTHVDYTIPDGIKGVENYAFSEAKSLESLTIPNSVDFFSPTAFNTTNYIEGDYYRLKKIYGRNATNENSALVENGKLIFVVPQCAKDYYVSDDITVIGSYCFHNKNVESVTLNDNVTVVEEYAFSSNKNLKRVVLSASLERIEGWNPFLGSMNLEEIYFRSYLPPAYSDTQFFESDCSHLTVYVPEETLELYKNSGWYQYAPYMVGYHYDDIGEWNPDFYMSTDYSTDGSVTTLQQSTTGAGINLILMGDAFSDRQIADGTYANVMQKAMNAFFSEEPYKSMKDRFNVYTVNVVSATEGYEHSGQALGTGHGDGANVYGNDSKVIEYAKKAVGEDRMDDALIIIMMNEDAYAGTCYMYNPPSGNYGRGLSIAYFPTSSNNDTFNGLVSHEAGGHGFAKLADEYAYEYLGAIPEDVATSEKARMLYGWNKNVDFTSDPAQVKWSQFLSDPRYANEGLGCFEGGLTYWTGVWRPSENSIMRYNTGGFNAPSRYAIWYRIGKLAYGESWEGSYEDFVAYDAINRTPAAVQKRQAQMRRQRLSKPLPPLAPPVVINHSWRDAE